MSVSMGKKEINTTWKALPIRSVAFFFYLNIYENIGTFFNVCIRCTAGFSLFAGRGTSRFSEGWKNEIDHYFTTRFKGEPYSSKHTALVCRTYFGGRYACGYE